MLKTNNIKKRIKISYTSLHIHIDEQHNRTNSVPLEFSPYGIKPNGIQNTWDSTHGIQSIRDSTHGIQPTQDSTHGIQPTWDSTHGIQLTGLTPIFTKNFVFQKIFYLEF